MVFLQGAARKEGPAGVCLELAMRGFIDLCISQEILDEVESVLSRPRIRTKFPALNDAMVASFLAVIGEHSQFFAKVPRRVALSRDPKDVPYLDLALHAAANYLVTRDSDLLDVPTGTDAESLAIREAAPDLQIVDPVAFLTFVRRDTLFK